MPGKNQRGLDVQGGTVGVGGGCVRSVGQGGPLGQVQGAGFGVGVNVERLRGRAQGVEEGGRAVAAAAGGPGRAEGHGLGAGSDGTHTRRCSGTEMVVMERVGRARGGRGRRGG